MISCLKEIQKKYHIIIYTASNKTYADSVLDCIDPSKEFFKVRLYRNNCIKIKSDSNEMIYIKDLRIIRNVRPENMIIIDNSVVSFSFHLDNGIPVLPFYSNKDDNELLYLKDYLLELEKSRNLKETNSKVFNLKKLIKEISAKDAREKEELEKENYIKTINSQINDKYEKNENFRN